MHGLAPNINIRGRRGLVSQVLLLRKNFPQRLASQLATADCYKLVFNGNQREAPSMS